MSTSARNPGEFLQRSLIMLLFATPLGAAQLDINGPAGSGFFGNAVLALANGNVAVTDPSGTGAVYVYDGNGQLISTLKGSHANDHVGSNGLVSLGNSKFLAISPSWSSDTATSVGAVTWIDGNTGINGVVSAANSLVGTRSGDAVGFAGVVVLANGNYVVGSPYCAVGGLASAGAVTWASGVSGIVGTVTSANSLVGASPGDLVSGGAGVAENTIVALANGNYVVRSGSWSNGAAANAGAVTWGNGSTGSIGAVSSANSLVGSATNDCVGCDGVTPLTNGNYVVGSTTWNGSRGAATWGNGASGSSGAVSVANSLVGSSSNSRVGERVIALSNGNFVVGSSSWSDGVTPELGAATWGSGNAALVAAVSAANSLVGTTQGAATGSSLLALTNGHYVVGSFQWSNGGTANVGAATWGNGVTGTTGAVSAVNSLIGSSTGDRVGIKLVALTNGNYVVASPQWDGATGNAGAATWRSGGGPGAGVVSAANSLVGSTQDDYVAGTAPGQSPLFGGGVVALKNGNYVVSSPKWANGGATQAGAVSWGNGTTGSSGAVSSSNSLVGADAYSRVGSSGVVALANGNYVVASAFWNNGPSELGAATWGNGLGGTTGTVSALNSLTGSVNGDSIATRVVAFSDSRYAVLSPGVDEGVLINVGAVTLGDGRFPLKGTLQDWNSVFETGNASIDYDVARQRLVIGRSAYNIVTLFTSDQIFLGNFDG